MEFLHLFLLSNFVDQINSFQDQEIEDDVDDDESEMILGT
jgi:hypothetical protein